MTLTQNDKNLMAAVDEFDLLNLCDADTLVGVAIKHNVDADDLFDAWSES